jgi:hypothetical protein
VPGVRISARAGSAHGLDRVFRERPPRSCQIIGRPQAGPSG